MTQGEEPDGTPTAPDAEGYEGDPDKDADATARITTRARRTLT
jgi:hypothetical protein